MQSSRTAIGTDEFIEVAEVSYISILVASNWCRGSLEDWDFSFRNNREWEIVRFASMGLCRGNADQWHNIGTRCFYHQSMADPPWGSRICQIIARRPVRFWTFCLAHQLSLFILYLQILKLLRWLESSSGSLFLLQAYPSGPHNLLHFWMFT